VGTAATGARERLHRVEERLNPHQARTWAIEELNELFAAGRAPDPGPDGLLRGRPVSSIIAPGFDALGRRLAGLYMPWLGKRFDRASNEGVNVLTKSALKPMKLLWPSYEPVEIFTDRVEAFKFKTKVAPGAVDPGVQVLKIDYDFDANPPFVLRRVLDELVQIDKGLYLGKVLYWLSGGFKPIGFFVLEK
jgi:hypothetical protein